VSSDREQLKNIVRDLLSEKVGAAGFELGKIGQKNEFMTFRELYGQNPAQFLFFRVPESMRSLVGLATMGWLAGGKDVNRRLAQALGVGSGDLAADFSKILAGITQKGNAGFKEVFPAVARHFTEVPGEKAENLSKGDLSALTESLSGDLESVVSKLSNIVNSSSIQEMITKYGSFVGADVDIDEVSDFLAKHSAETTGDLAALEDTLRNKEIPEWIDSMFGEWRQGFSELVKDFPEQQGKMIELFDNARAKLSL